MLNWCLFSRSELEKLLSTDFEKGLSGSAALLRSTETDAATKEIRDFFFPFTAFLRNIGAVLSDFSVLMLFVSALLCEVFAEHSASALNIIIGFIFACAVLRTVLVLYSRYSSEKRMQNDSYKVLRDGKIKNVKGTQLVRGDVIILSKGDIVPRDLRLVDSENLSVIEKYNGKRVKPVSKDAMFYPIKMKDIPLRYKKNMVFEGSAVTSGSALAVVIDEKMTLAVMRSILHINDDVAELYNDESPRNASVGMKFARRSSFGTSKYRDNGYSEDRTVTANAERMMSVMKLCGLCVGTVVFVIGLFAKTLISDSFLLAVAVMACAPSMLYEMCIAACFAAGSARLARQGVTIRDFDSAEKLALSKSILCCGSTAFSVDKMVAEACYIGRSMDFSVENSGKITKLCELLLCTAELYYKTDKNGIRSIGGDLEGFAVLEGARKIGAVRDGSERQFIERLSEFHDINGSLTGSFCLYRGRTVLITKGRVASELRKCSHYDIDGVPAVLDDGMRERILENAKAFENNESCHVVAVCYKNCDYVDRRSFRGDFVFAGFAVFGTRINYESAKYVEILRRNGITPVVFSNVVSDMVIGDSKRIGVLRPSDNYITAKTLSALDEKIYSDDLESYTLYMGLGSVQKSAVVRNKKYSERLVAVAADKPGDAFDMSEGDVLISFGKDAPKTLRRISDIHSKRVGIGVIYRAICICRNMIRSASLSTGYLVCAQVSAMVFCFFGIISAFFTGGSIPMQIPQFLAATLMTDLVVSLLAAVIKTPASIISDNPEEFYSYYEPRNILPKATFAGVVCGLVSFVAFLVGVFTAKNIEAGAASAFTVLYLSKCLVSLLCIMTTSTRKAPAHFPAAAFVCELVMGIIFALCFGKTVLPIGYGVMLPAVCAVLCVLPVGLTFLYLLLDGKQ